MSNESASAKPAFDWSRFVKRVPVKSEVKTLYDAWCTKSGIESWFLRNAIYTSGGKPRAASERIQQGDEYEWYWHGWGDETVEKGTILEANGKDRMKFMFGKAGDVTVVIREEGGERLVELTQENIPQDEESKRYFHLGCSTGWTFYLANLKSILEGGIDLRNRNPALKNVINS